MMNSRLGCGTGRARMVLFRIYLHEWPVVIRNLPDDHRPPSEEVNA